MKTTIVSATLPKVITVTDYHEFRDLEETLKIILDKKVKVKELGFADGEYVGVVYAGKQPTKGELAIMLANKGIAFDDLEEDIA